MKVGFCAVAFTNCAVEPDGRLATAQFQAVAVNGEIPSCRIDPAGPEAASMVAASARAGVARKRRELKSMPYHVRPTMTSDFVYQKRALVPVASRLPSASGFPATVVTMPSGVIFRMES